MKTYEFEKAETVYLNGRKTNIYNVYQIGREEESEKIKEESYTKTECERPGVTVDTSRAKVITQRASNANFIKVNKDPNCRIFVTKIDGRNKKEAEENFYNI